VSDEPAVAQGHPGLRVLPAAVVLAVLVGAVLVGAGLAGHALAGPPSAPAVLPAPDCPPTLGEALPREGPVSPLVVPWGPLVGQVCLYPAVGSASPDAAPVAGTATLDPTAVAEVSGLLHPLPPAAAGCPRPATGDVAVLLLRYRPGATPTVADVLPVALWSAAPASGPTCRRVTNGTVTLDVPQGDADRLVDRVPLLRTVLGAG
jgi:hypothetical protein